MTETIALVVAAGRGRRFGGDLPKQYAPLAGKTVLRHTLRALLDHPRVDSVQVVIHHDDQDLYQDAVEGMELLPPVFGGATRQDSVRLGLESLEARAPDAVLIHDAARPFVSAAQIDAVIDALATHPGALPVVAVADTLKRSGTGTVVDGTVSRAELYRAQTPQGFRFADILAAHRQLAGQELTDDAQLFEHLGLDVALCAGGENNFKITTSEDLMRAERLIAAQSETRTGQGYDVHRFGDGTFVTLCGVEISHTHGLTGHSDADVALHALTDALLGAIGAGDIGEHFPPTDSQWKGASSDRFLRHACDLVHARGGEIVNVDVTLICQAPKVGPHRRVMCEKVAEILGIAPDRVSVKATTTEGLGFTGRQEGIAAQALANVRLGTVVA